MDPKAVSDADYDQIPVSFIVVGVELAVVSWKLMIGTHIVATTEVANCI